MRKSVKVGVASVGLLLIASPAAAQSDTMTSVGNIGIANGNQIKVDPLQIPINACGNAIGVLGFAAAACQDGHAKASLNSGHGRGGHGGDGTVMTSFLNPGILNGNQADVMIQIPINLCGNAIAVLGGAFATCRDGSATANAHSRDGNDHRPRPYGNHPRKAQARDKVTTKADRPAQKDRKAAEAGLLGGLLAPLTSLLGGPAQNADADPARNLPFGGRHATCGNDVMTSVLNPGILNGNQAIVKAQVPVNISGNAVGVLGGAVATAQNTSATADYC